MTHTASSEALLEKIRALRAKAEDPSTTEAEAEAFAAKVADLLARHNLSTADLVLEEDSGIETTVWDPRYPDPWRRSLSRWCARLYMCERVLCDVRYTKRLRRGPHAGEEVPSMRTAFMVVGRPHNVDVCVSMLDYLNRTVMRLARQYSSVRSEHLAFERGCGDRLADRLFDLYMRQMHVEDHVTADNSRLPALYQSESQQIESWMEQNMDLTSVRSGPGSDLSGEHADAGAEAADGVSLSAQLSGGQSALEGPR